MGAKVTEYKLKPPEASESVIRRAVRQILRFHGWYVVLHQQGLGAHKGFPDLTAYKDGICIMIETKKPSGSLSKDQRVFREDIMQAGMLYIVVRSPEEIINWLDKIRMVCPDNNGHPSVTITPAKGMRVEVVE